MQTVLAKYQNTDQRDQCVRFCVYCQLEPSKGLSIFIEVKYNVKTWKYFTMLTEGECIRCWVCGDNAKPHGTNSLDPNRPNFALGTHAWCSTISTAACQGGSDVFCYKELWNVDGVTSK